MVNSTKFYQMFQNLNQR